jgi:hypothetical protein
LEDGVPLQVVESKEERYGRHDKEEAYLGFSGKAHSGQK